MAKLINLIIIILLFFFLLNMYSLAAFLVLSSISNWKLYLSFHTPSPNQERRVINLCRTTFMEMKSFFVLCWNFMFGRLPFSYKPLIAWLGWYLQSNLYIQLLFDYAFPFCWAFLCAHCGLFYFQCHSVHLDGISAGGYEYWKQCSKYTGFKAAIPCYCYEPSIFACS